MKVTAMTIPDVLLIELDVFSDARGDFCERFHEKRFERLGLPTHFRQDNQSHSVKNVLRGLHYQLHRPQGKLVQCIRGAVFDVAVDIRVGSPTFGQSTRIELAENRKQLLWIPPGFAHGFCALSEVAGVHYQCTEMYAQTDDRGILWCDAQLAIPWPVADPILSVRDRSHPTLAAARDSLPRYDDARAAERVPGASRPV